MTSIPPWILNLASITASISIITCNHILLHMFPYVFTLSFLHYTFTALSLQFLRYFTAQKNQKSTPAPMNSLVILGLLATAANCFQNASLRHNTVASYSMYKLFVIPAQVVIYYVVYQKKFSFESICSLFVLLFGVYLSTEPEMSNKWTGFVLGTSAAVIVVPLQTVYVAEKCREYKWSSIECNFQTTPFVSFFSLLLAFFIESKGVQSTCVILMADGMLPIFLMWIGLSCLCAVGVNILTIAISRRSSAISYSVLGHVKTIGVITVSVLRGNERPSLQILAGLICAMSGSWFYSAAEGKRIKVE